MITKLTLAYNAARAKAALQRQEAKVKRLCEQLIDRVGTGGETIKTNLGTVVITAETHDRAGEGFNMVFDSTKYMDLPTPIKNILEQKGVVTMQRRKIAGMAPKVQFRLNA